MKASEEIEKLFFKYADMDNDYGNLFLSKEAFEKFMQEYSDQQAQHRYKKALAIFTDQNFFDGLNVEKHFPTTVKALKIAAGIDNDKTE